MGQVGPQLRRVRPGGRRGDALADADVAWRDIEFVAGADTIRNGYPGFVAGATFAQALGWTGAQSRRQLRRLRVGRPGPAARPGPSILAGFADVALVIGADTTPKGFFAPVGRRAQGRTRTGCASTSSAPPTRRTSPSTPGAASTSTATPTEDFALVKVKNSKAGLHNPNARFRKEITVEEVLASPDRHRPAAPARRSAPPPTAAPPSSSCTPSTPAQARHPRGHACASRPSPTSRRPTRRCASSCPTSPPTPRAVVAAAGRSASRTRSPARLRGGRPRARRPRPGRGLRPLHRARARLVREHRPVRRGRGRASSSATASPPSAAASRSTPRGGLSSLRRGHPGPGHRPGVRAHLAAPGPGEGRQVEGATRRPHRQPGPVRPRLVRHPDRRP